MRSLNLVVYMSESLEQASLRESLASVAEIYDVLYGLKKIGFYRILKEIVKRGIRKRTSALQKLRTIVRLHEEEVIGLRLDYYLHMVKLGMAVVYLAKSVDCAKLPNVVPFLRSCINAIPAGTILNFYYPERLRPKSIGETDVKHYTFYERIFNRADVSRYAPEIAENPLVLFSRRKMEEHFTKELRKSRDEEDLPELRTEVYGYEVRPKIDNKDLAVVRSLEFDPLTTASLDVKLGIKKNILEKHVEHVEAILRGIRVRKIGNVMNASRATIIAVASGKEKQVLRFTNAVLRYPTVVASIVSNDLRFSSLQLLLPGDIDTIRDITLALKKIVADYDLELIDCYLADLRTLINFSIPYRRELEYSPLARDWLERSVRITLKYLKGV